MNYLTLFVVFPYIILFVYGNDSQNDTDNSPQQSRLQTMRQRSRDQWINNLRQHVLDTLGFSSPPQIDEDTKNAILSNLTISGMPYKSIIQQCYSASCSLPNWIDEEMWNDPDTKTLRLYFDVLTPDDPSTTILNATLSLHIKERTACHCLQSEDGEEEDSVRFTVFVSQFLKPLRRRNRVPRMRILDVQMVVVRRDTWIDFNVAEAIQEWSNRRRRRHGLEVNVIDSQGFPIDAKAVFGTVDCNLPADVECQDMSIPVAMQKSLNYSTVPALEVYTETRPRISFRGKRSTEENVVATNVVDAISDEGYSSSRNGDKPNVEKQKRKNHCGPLCQKLRKAQLANKK